MQIVIEIDERYYTDIKDSEHCGNYSVLYALEAIRNGKLLPKGHGELKDVDAIHKEIERLQSGIAKNGVAVNISRDIYKGMCYARGIINEAPTIIKADKEERR